MALRRRAANVVRVSWGVHPLAHDIWKHIGGYVKDVLRKGLRDAAFNLCYGALTHTMGCPDGSGLYVYREDEAPIGNKEHLFNEGGWRFYIYGPLFVTYAVSQFVDREKVPLTYDEAMEVVRHIAERSPKLAATLVAHLAFPPRSDEDHMYVYDFLKAAKKIMPYKEGEINDYVFWRLQSKPFRGRGTFTF
ncbi:MAG: hypothetical protein ACK4SY_07155 [Pyrobaculum sp.]